MSGERRGLSNKEGVGGHPAWPTSQRVTRALSPSFTWQDEVGTPSPCPRPGLHQQVETGVAVGQQPRLAGDSTVADTIRARPLVNSHGTTAMEGFCPGVAPTSWLLAEGGDSRSSFAGSSVQHVPHHRGTGLLVVQAWGTLQPYLESCVTPHSMVQGPPSNAGSLNSMPTRPTAPFLSLLGPVAVCTPQATGWPRTAVARDEDEPWTMAWCGRPHELPKVGAGEGDTFQQQNPGGPEF